MTDTTSSLMTTLTQGSLFGDPEHDHCCKTCGATRPDGYPRHLFLEPVSMECHDCNHATLAEIIRAAQAGDRAAYEAAWARHYPGKKRRAAGLA